MMDTPRAASRVRASLASTLLVVPLALTSACGGQSVDTPAEPLPGAAESTAYPIAESTIPPMDEPTMPPATVAADGASADTGSPGDAAAPAAGETVTFTVDSTASTASYAVDEEFFGGAVERLNKIAGQFLTVGTTTGVSGELMITAGEPPTIAGGEIRVDLAGLTSDESRRDRRVREQVLDTMTFPEAVFTPTAMEGFPAGYQPGQEATFKLLGDLTIRDVTLPVTFDVTATYADGRLDGTATTQFSMLDFGVQPPTMLDVFSVGDAVTVTVILVATESAS